MSNDRLSELADDSTTEQRVENLVIQVELLTEENRQLRAEYTRSQQLRHRRTAFGMAALGVLSALAAIPFENSRSVLFALAGTGLFASVLTYYLTPQRFVSAAIGERIYSATAASGDRIVSDLGLQDTRVYVPSVKSGDDGFADVRLFVPQHTEYVLPDSDELTAPFVVTKNEMSRGVSFYPIGATLFDEFETTMSDALQGEPSTLADQLAEAIVEGFELADSIQVDLGNGESITIGIRGSACGPVDRFDHPIVSFFATGLATGLDVPIVAEVNATDDDRFEYLVSFRRKTNSQDGTR